MGDEEDLRGSEMIRKGINWISRYDGVMDEMKAITKIRHKDSGALTNL